MIYVIGGPTGTGKTQLAVALAKQWQAPIMNADVYQMYQGMDIGTNKDLETMAPFHPYLYNHLPLNEPMTVARYQQDFRELIDKLSSKHHRILVVGGTGLYIKASLYDFHFAKHAEPADMSEFTNWDNDRLYHHLQTLDRASAQKIHPHNRRRVLRAIAIFLQTGQTKTQQEITPERKLLYPATFIGVLPARTTLYASLDARVDQMIANGLVEEVKGLIHRYGKSSIALQAIGYKELIAYLDGELSLDAAIASIKLATRRYAKRQLTYFRHQFPTQWYASWQQAYEALIQ